MKSPRRNNARGTGTGKAWRIWGFCLRPAVSDLIEAYRGVIQWLWWLFCLDFSEILLRDKIVGISLERNRALWLPALLKVSDLLHAERSPRGSHVDSSDLRC